MKKIILTLTLLWGVANLQLTALHFGLGFVQAQEDTLWIRYDDRFKANGRLLLTGIDSLEVKSTQFRFYANDGTSRAQIYTQLVPTDEASMQFTNPGRILLKPSIYSSTNYTNASATQGYNFQHMVEGEHFAVFWDVRYGENAAKIQYPGDGNVANANTVLSIGENCWKKYCELGFMKPGESTTDRYKIQLYIPYQSEWRADASGTDGASGGKTGIGHFNPWAANARGGHTIAHEVGHTFQYLVSADLGMSHGFNYGYGDGASGGNGWWESCANWQAYKVYPSRQFTDGEYFEGHLPLHHLNLLHEDWRYQNCFIQDWWCMKHGQDFVGRLWRESNKPEDPVEAYKRLCGLSQAEFCDEQMEGYMRMATWDIDGIRDAARSRIGQHQGVNHIKLAQGQTDTWQLDSAHCVQNYGYNIINMATAKGGTTVRAHFHGIVGEKGYRSVQPSRAGWRYAFVALTSSGQRLYGDIQSEADGVAELTLPSTITRLFFVVMGAPTTHWRHPWDDNPQNDEQWPYQVRFEETKPLGK